MKDIHFNAQNAPLLNLQNEVFVKIIHKVSEKLGFNCNITLLKLKS